MYKSLRRVGTAKGISNPSDVAVNIMRKIKRNYDASVLNTITARSK